MNRLLPVVVAIVLSAGCGVGAEGGLFDFGASSTGAVRGRIVYADAAPAPGVRVSLDSLSGRSTITNPMGEFFLGNARDGDHALYAYDPGTDSAAAIGIVVSGGEANVGDVLLEDCATVLTDPGSAGESPSAFTPCSGEGLPDEPPPMLSSDLGTLDIAWGEAHIDTMGIQGFLEGASANVSLDFNLTGSQYSNPGGASYDNSVQNDYGSGNIEALIGVYDYATGAYFVLANGNVSLDVVDNADGDPTTREFTFSGSQMLFELLLNGEVDPNYTLTVDSVDAMGLAFVESGP